MMRLSPYEIEKSSRIRKFLMNNNSVDDLEKYKCNKCDGLGLDMVYKNSYGGYSGDVESYCARCDGVGYVKIDKREMRTCVKCGGIGRTRLEGLCERCNGTGWVNWLEDMIK